MKTAKKLLSLLLALTMVLGMVACGPASNPEDTTPSETDPVETTAPVTAEYPLTPEELGAGEVKWSETTTEDGWIEVTNEGGTTLGYSPDSGVTLIQVEGYAFKDLNRNGKLDVYEDWRQEDNARAADLASQLPLEAMFGLMYHANMKGIEADGSDAKVGDLAFSEMMATTGLRTALNRGVGTTDPILMVTWNNNAQAQAEALDYGIPVNISANPAYPGDVGFANNLALAATFDPELVLDVFTTEAKLYRSTGVTTNLGPMLDLTTEPRWNRTFGTFGEDPALSRDMAQMAVTGLQSTFDENGNDLGWGEDSVIAMLKHWPGDGAGENGRESHSASGKYTVYPGGGFKTILIPYVDGGLDLDSATGSAQGIMMSYSIAYSDDETYGELVASPYSQFKLDLLRGDYGFDGLVCCDWGSLTDKAYGLEEATEAERIAIMIKVGMDQLGGVKSADFEGAWEILKADMGEEAALARVQDSARRITRTFFQIGLFDNAYIHVNETKELYASEEVADLKYESQVRSVVMLKNENNAVHELDTSAEKPTVYVPLTVTMTFDTFANIKGSEVGMAWDMEELSKYYNVVTDTLGEPTGVNEDGSTYYTVDDIIRASAEEVANCSAALVMIHNAINEGSEGDGFGHDNETDEYFPISLMYGEYIANSDSVRTESISGDMIETEVEDVYGTITVTQKEDRSYEGKASRIVNTYDLELVEYVASVMPESATITVCIDTDKTIIVNEFEHLVDAILVGYRIPYAIYLEVASGKVEPTGLLPLQIPANMETVEAQLEDIPRDVECHVDTAGHTYDFGYGMNWSGVIQDERTATYCVAPLTTPEN